MLLSETSTNGKFSTSYLLEGLDEILSRQLLDFARQLKLEERRKYLGRRELGFQLLNDFVDVRSFVGFQQCKNLFFVRRQLTLFSK